MGDTPADGVRIQPEYLRDRGRDLGKMAEAVRFPGEYDAATHYRPSLGVHPQISEVTAQLSREMSRSRHNSETFVTSMGASIGFYRDMAAQMADVFQSVDETHANDVDRNKALLERMKAVMKNMPRDARVPKDWGTAPDGSDPESVTGTAQARGGLAI